MQHQATINPGPPLAVRSIVTMLSGLSLLLAALLARPALVTATCCQNKVTPQSALVWKGREKSNVWSVVQKMLTQQL